MELTKKCPECGVRLKMNEYKCFSCGTKFTKEVDKMGFAKRPINWMGYLSTLAGLFVLGYFIWYVFLKDQ